MPISIEYTSFLIRVWREQNPEREEPPADWCGEVEHIQTGQLWTFSTLDELLGFLHRQVNDLGMLEGSE